jgi:hypothetical protein
LKRTRWQRQRDAVPMYNMQVLVKCISSSVVMTGKINKFGTLKNVLLPQD